MNSQNEAATKGSLDIQNITVHPQYVPGRYSLDYDFAIITLNDPLYGSPDIKPVCLLTDCQHEEWDDRKCNISGYGVVDGNSRTSTDQLQIAHMMIANMSECRNTMNPPIRRAGMSITDRMLCAGEKSNFSSY